MKSLGLVAGRCSDPDLRGVPIEKRNWVWTFKPYVVAPLRLGSSKSVQGPLRSHLAPRRRVSFMVCMCYQDVSTPGALFFPPPGPGPPLLGSLTSSFILACIRCPSSTCRANLYKTDICPISPIPELLGMVGKAEEYGSVRGGALNGNESSFPGYS